MVLSWWCQRIQLLIIDLASSQQSRPPGPKVGVLGMGEIHARHHSSTMDRHTIWKESRRLGSIVHGCVDYNELLPLLLPQLLAGIPHPVSAVTQLPRAPSNPSPSNERAPTYLPTIYQPTYYLPFTILPTRQYLFFSNQKVWILRSEQTGPWRTPIFKNVKLQQ